MDWRARDGARRFRRTARAATTRWSAHLGPAPRKRREHPSVRARKQHRDRGAQVGAAHVEGLPGYLGVSIGVASACLAASAQRAPSKPTASSTRRLPPTLMRNNAASSSRKLAGNALRRRARFHGRAAEDRFDAIRGSRAGRARPIRRRTRNEHGQAARPARPSAPSRASRSRARTSSAPRPGARSRDCRRARGGRADGGTTYRSRAETARSTGTTAMLAAIAKSRSDASAPLTHGPYPAAVTLMQSASKALLTTSDVMPKLTNGNVTPVSGSTATLPATVTASWHKREHHPGHGDPAQERLAVGDDASRTTNKPRFAAGHATVMPYQPVQPHRGAEGERPRRRPAEHTDQRRERVIAVDLRRNAGAACAGEAAPRHGAQSEAVGRRRFAEPRDERQLIVGGRERRRQVFQAARSDFVDGAELEDRRVTIAIHAAKAPTASRRRRHPRRCARATTSRSTPPETRRRRSPRSAAAPCRASRASRRRARTRRTPAATRSESARRTGGRFAPCVRPPERREGRRTMPRRPSARRDPAPR